MSQSGSCAAIIARKAKVRLVLGKTVTIKTYERTKLNTTSKKVQGDRIGAGRRLATKYGIYVILKGARTIIATPDGDVYINPTGNPGMATAGTGDVLSGIIAGFLCQGFSAKDSSILGVYLHGMAGDISASNLSQTALIASDLIRALPEVIKRIEPCSKS